MTYAGFLVLFVVVPTLVAGWLLRRWLRPRDALPIAGMALVAFVSAYPWDSWAVTRGYWAFDPARVLAWVGPLPVEECSFFLLQTALVGVLTLALLRRAAG